MEITKFTHPFLHFLGNLRRMLALGWDCDKKLIIGYYLSAAAASAFYIFTTFTLAKLIDLILLNQVSPGPSTIPIAIITILATRYILNVLSGITSWTIQQVYFDYLLRWKLQNYISYRFYKKLSRLDIAHLEDSETRNLITKARDTMLWRLPDMLRQFAYLFNSGISVIITAFILLRFGPWIPVVVVSSIVPLFVMRLKFGSAQWSIYGSGAPEVKKLWYFTWILSEENAIKESRIFKATDFLLKKFKETQEYILSLNLKPLRQYMYSAIAPSFFETAILFIIAYLYLPNVLAGVITIGSYTLLVNMIDNLNNQVGGALSNLSDMYSHSLYVDHYFDVLKLPATIKESEDPKVFHKIKPPSIKFEDVSFAYPKSREVLHKISFSIKPGEKVAFVGENGAGKSTIVKLLCRFYDITSGRILINDIDLRDIKLSNWYDFLGTLFQDFVKFDFTIKENIILGKPEHIDDAKILDAAKSSGAYEFIKDFPNGFDTMLGKQFEDGVELSQGQWQKLAIARAFYEEAPVLILDEPTSAIDAEAEYEIFNNLEKAYKDKSLILVSHRFSTVRNADKIFVVDNGKITEQGSHEELLNLNGKYAKMFTIQARGYQ